MSLQWQGESKAPDSICHVWISEGPKTNCDSHGCIPRLTDREDTLRNMRDGVETLLSHLAEKCFGTYSDIAADIAADKQDDESRMDPSLEKQRDPQLGPIRSRLEGIHLPRADLEPDPTMARDGQGESRRHEVPIAVVEQRVSNLTQGSLCLVLLTGPFLHVLNLVPRGVLAGLL